MASTIKTKRSAVAGKVPLTTDIALGELAVNTYDGKLFLKKNDGAESVVEVGGGAGGGSTTIVSKTSTYTAVAGDYILADTTSGAFTITLPANPTVGDSVIIADPVDNWDTNNITVGRNGSTVEAISDNLILNLPGVKVTFVYTGATWQVYAEVGFFGGDSVTPDSTHTLTNKTIHGNTNTLTVDGTEKVGYLRVPLNGDKTSSYGIVSGDVGRCVTIGSGGSVVISDWVFQPGDVVSLYNATALDATVTCSVTTAYIGGTDENKATMTLAPRGVATVLFLAGNACVVTGNVS